MSRVLLSLAAAVSMLAIVTTAHAATVFSDDYENRPTDTFARPFGGTYYFGSARVQDGASGFSGIPNGPIGKNYLDVIRDVDFDPNHFAFFEMTPQTTIGQTVHAEFNIYAKNGGAPQFGLMTAGSPFNQVDQPDDGLILLTGNTSNGFIQSFNGTSQVLFQNATFTLETWQKWEIDYVIGDSAFDLTVNGVTETMNGMVTPGGIVHGIWFWQSGPTAYAVDDVLVTGPTAPLSGDFNLDGTVDNTDFNQWVTDFGTSFTATDTFGNNDGIVDEADYTIWQDNFGATSGSLATATSSVNVPEPASVLLALAGSLMATGLVRRERAAGSTSAIA